IFVVTRCLAKRSSTVTSPSLSLLSLFSFCFNILLNAVTSSPCPYTTLFRSHAVDGCTQGPRGVVLARSYGQSIVDFEARRFGIEDRKSTRLNSSHGSSSYAVFCLKKKIYFCVLLQYLVERIRLLYQSGRLD